MKSAIDTLAQEFREFRQRENITEEGDATELLMGADLTSEQRQWINAFIVRWDEAAEADPAFYDKQTVVEG